jgi:hypothetical protein
MAGQQIIQWLTPRESAAMRAGNAHRASKRRAAGSCA